MRIGITGASGFMGSRLLSLLKERGVSVSAYRRKKNLSFDNYCFKSFVRNKDIIYHLAGVNRASEQEIITGNLLATLHLTQAVLESGNNPRIVFVSSSQVYDPTEKSPIEELCPANPVTLYGLAKKSSEDLLRLSRLNYVILRITNVYGPGCRPYYNSAVATFCDRAVRRQPLIINGDGSQGRDFIYIDDVVEALFMVKEGKLGIYNVSSGKIVSLKRLTKEIKREVSSLSLEYLKEEKLCIPSYCCDNSRFMKEYGWKPKISLRRGVRETLQWARNQMKK